MPSFRDDHKREGYPSNYERPQEKEKKISKNNLQTPNKGMSSVLDI